MAVSDWTFFAALFCLAVLHLPRSTWCSDLDGWGTLGELATSDCSVHFYDEQKLDHFNPDDTRVFSQRFTVCQNYTTSENSPLLVYIGGESPEGSDSPYTGTTYSRFSQAVGGVFIDLEHRYYGLSYVIKTDIQPVSWVSPSDNRISPIDVLTRAARPIYPSISLYSRTPGTLIS
jgi:hypothetical protein